MSPSGLVMMRVVKFAPEVEKIPFVVPAAKISSLPVVVVTVPLLADALVAEPEEPTSNGLTGSRPLYSKARRSTNGVAVLKVTVIALDPAGAVLMLLA